MTDDEEEYEYEDEEPGELETGIISLLTDRVLALESTSTKQGFQLKVLMGGLVLTGFGFVFVNKLLTNIVGAINAGQEQAPPPNSVPGFVPHIAPEYEHTVSSRPDVPMRDVGGEYVVDETITGGDPVSPAHDPVSSGDVETPFAESVPEVHQSPWKNGLGVDQEPGSRTLPHG